MVQATLKTNLAINLVARNGHQMKLCKLDLHYTLEMENVPPFLCNITEFVPELIYKKHH